MMTATSATTSGSKDGRCLDILVLGRTGQGKSTLANLLLGIDAEKKTLFGAQQTEVNLLATAIKPLDSDSDGKLYFETGDGAESVTNTCKVLSKEDGMIRVMDTVGFNSASYEAANSRLKCFQQIVQFQKVHSLQFSRVLYFLPIRGAPERAEGTLQEEIKVMYDYYDQHIFDIMVIIATNNKRDHYQAAGFTDDDAAATRAVFLAAFKAATGTNLPRCPPVVYLSIYENHQTIFHRVVNAGVISDAKRLCYPTGLKSEYQCTFCAVRFVLGKPPFGKEEPLCVINEENGIEENYDDSMCHPLFIPKHSLCTRILGGLGNIFTMGMLSLIGACPGCFNSEEICANCEKPPGSRGCCSVRESINIDGETYMVDHVMP